MRPTQSARQKSILCAPHSGASCATAKGAKRVLWVAWLWAAVAVPGRLLADEPTAPVSPGPSAAPTASSTPSVSPGPTTSPTASTTPAPSAPASIDEGQLGDLDRRTRELRDQVFRSKARLTLLTESLLGSAQGGAKLVVVQKDQMGRLFQMVKVSYQLDGREVFVRSLEPGRQTESKEQVVYDGNIRPGDHTVGVAVVYRGDGNKVFSYYDQYMFTAKAAHRFSVTDGQTTRLEVLCREKGNPLLTRVEDRPSFDFRVESTKKAN